ncbi:MAG: hypothetical protein ACREBZ_00350 [Thermoplasmata archaeon]
MGAPSLSGAGFCAQCGRPRVFGHRFCQSCGAAFPDTTTPARPSAVPYYSVSPPGGAPPQPPGSTGITLLVVIVIVVAVPSALAVLVYVEFNHANIGPGATPIGAAFAPAFPSPGSCSTTMLSEGACVTAGDYTYNLSIVASSVTFASVELEVNTATGANFENSGLAEIAIVTDFGEVAAHSVIAAGHGLVMGATWGDYGTGFGGSSTLSSQFVIVIDMGQSSSTAGQGLSFVAIGIGAYSGTTAPLTLP